MIEKKSFPLTALIKENIITVGFDNNKFILFKIGESAVSLHEWSKRNLFAFPQNYLTRYNRISGFYWLSQKELIVYTAFTYAYINLE